MAGFLVFKQNVVQKLGAHVLWGSQFVLFEAFKDKGGSIVNQLKVELFV